MAGGSPNRSIGVGPVLRNAREIRGCSFDEAARDTKLRADQLRALEAEDFDALPGDVYVRGSLRTYAAYLGVDPDVVIQTYTRYVDEPSPQPPPPKMDRIERAMAASRLRDNPVIVLLAAAAVLVALLAVGVLSRGRGSPLPAPISTITVSPDLGLRPLDMALEAKRDVTVTLTIDGLDQTFAMKTGETRSFTAQHDLAIRVADGASLHIVINGEDLGVPGQAGSPWEKQWTNGAGATSSPSA